MGDAPRVLVIDPLIDANSGQQSSGTVQMEELLRRLVQSTFPGMTIYPLKRSSLEQGPILLMGTLTPVNTANANEQGSNAFRIWLTLVDLRTGRIIAKALDRATVESVNSNPLTYYRDSPTWHKDRTTAAYINSCQANSKVGDFVDPTYLMRLPAQAMINEALIAFLDGNMVEAERLFRESQPIADSDDLRVANGLYLTSWRLGKKDEARKAFDRIAAAGIHARRLPLKILFEPGTTSFVRAGDLSQQYTLWIREVALQATQSPACLRVTGHTSHTGPLQVNEELSLARASEVRSRMQESAAALAGRITVAGLAWRENLVGIGTDDTRDSLDRRVEFGVVDCVAK